MERREQGTFSSENSKEAPTEADPTILLEFSMTPLDKGESVGAYVARSLDIVDRSGLEYRLNPMGTVIEGPWSQVFSVIRACFDRMRADCNRISVYIKVDYRKGRKGAITGKVQSVERRLQREVKKS